MGNHVRSEIVHYYFVHVGFTLTALNSVWLKIHLWLQRKTSVTLNWKPCFGPKNDHAFLARDYLFSYFWIISQAC
jgi:hypothetical protein